MSVSSGRRAPPQIRDRIVGLRRVRADELLPNPKNWRRHPKAQADALKGLLGEIGYADALLARETPEGLMLIDGHLRAETTPTTKVPVLVLDLDEAEADKLLLTLDPLAAMAEMDGGATAALLEGVQTESEAVQAMLGGLRDQAQRAMGPGEGLTDPDAVPEVAEPVSKRGDVWLCGDHRVMCGDSTDAEDVARLMAGEKADAVVADPPYGINVVGPSGTIGGGNLAKVGHYSPIVGDDTPFDPTPWLDAAPFVALFGANYFSNMLPPKAGWVVWDKREGTSPNTFADCELIWTNQNRPARIIRCLWLGMIKEGESSLRVHPTQKPIKVLSDLMEGCGETILDPFLGSGTTMIAAERLGRRCYGMEIEPRYVDVAVRRWEDFTGRKAKREHARTKVKAHA